MPARAPKGRNVKSELGQGTAGAADGNEGAKDFLTASELAALLEAAKAGRHGTRDHLLLMMMFRRGKARPAEADRSPWLRRFTRQPTVRPRRPADSAARIPAGRFKTR